MLRPVIKVPKYAQLLQKDVTMTADLRELMQHPALQQMIRYSFVGTKASVKPQLEAFVEETGVDELIAVSIMHSVADRLKSVRLFAEVMEAVKFEYCREC